MKDKIYKPYELISGKITADCQKADIANCCLLVGGLEIPFSIASKDYEALVEMGFLRKTFMGKVETRIIAGDTQVID